MRPIDAICSIAHRGNLALALEQARHAVEFRPKLECRILLADDFPPPQVPAYCRLVRLESLDSSLARASVFLRPAKIAPDRILRPVFLRYLLAEAGFQTVLFLDPTLRPLGSGEFFGRRASRARAMDYEIAIRAPWPDERPASMGNVDQLHGWLAKAFLKIPYLWVTSTPVVEEFLIWWIAQLLGRPRYFYPLKLSRGLPDSVYDGLALEPAESRIARRCAVRSGADFAEIEDIPSAPAPAGEDDPFSRFNNGVPVPDALRELYRSLPDSLFRFPDPFATGKGSFFEWAMRADQTGWFPLLRKIRSERPDLKALTELELTRWFRVQGWRELRMPRELI